MKTISLLKSYRYELVAFLTGAAIMTLEIVGARLIAPQFGASTYVWTAMIGVILGALAIGFAVGGRLADTYHSPAFLGQVLSIAALLILFMGLTQAATLEDIARFNLDLRLSALLAAIVLFGLPSLLIGMVSPHLAKIRVTSLETTGQSIGKLEAAGALGSIAGTFLCGYYLLGQFGSRSIVIGIVVLLIITSFIVDPFYKRKLRLGILLIALLLGTIVGFNPPGVLADVDSPYSRYRVLDSFYGDTPARLLITDNTSVQSGAASDGSSKILFKYVQKFASATQAYGDAERVLMIGGGTFTFPTYLIGAYPDLKVDVVEIDPKLKQLANQYFYLKDSPRLTIYQEDGRAYINRTAIPYDIVYMDAFSSLSPPFQLTTQETVRHIERNLSPDGVVVVNLIGAHQDGTDEYSRAVKETYASVFAHTEIYQADKTEGLGDRRQNLMLYASNDASQFAAITANNGSPLPFKPAPELVLTDNYAPIERLTF